MPIILWFLSQLVSAPLLSIYSYSLLSKKMDNKWVRDSLTSVTMPIFPSYRNVTCCWLCNPRSRICWQPFEELQKWYNGCKHYVALGHTLYLTRLDDSLAWSTSKFGSSYICSILGLYPVVELIRNDKYPWLEKTINSHWNSTCLIRPSLNCLIHWYKRPA